MTTQTPPAPPAPPTLPKPPLPRILDDEWEPPPGHGRFPIVAGASVGTVLLVIGIAFVTIRAGVREQAVGMPTSAPASTRSLGYPDDSGHSAWSFVTASRTPSKAVQAPNPLTEPPRAARRAVVPRRPAPSGTGYLSINSKPWAEVSVDGRVIGNTPLRGIAVTSGRHQLALTQDGFETRRTWITVQPGDTLRITGIVLARIGS